MAKDRNLVSRVEPLEFIGLSLAGARLNRMELILESELQQHPVGAHRARRSRSPQSQIMRHGRFIRSLFQLMTLVMFGTLMALVIKHVKGDW